MNTFVHIGGRSQEWLTDRIQKTLSESFSINLSSADASALVEQVFSLTKEEEKSQWANLVIKRIHDYLDQSPDSHIREIYWDFYEEKQLLGLAITSDVNQGTYTLYFPNRTNDEVLEVFNRKDIGRFFTDSDLDFVRNIAELFPDNFQASCLLKWEVMNDLFISRPDEEDMIVIFDKYSSSDDGE